MDHWPLHARNWACVGPPLRPCAEDVAAVEAVVSAHAGGRAIEALILGVTPELVGMAVPAGSSIVAVDHEPEMVEALFVPGQGRRALVGAWLTLPLRAGSIDVAVGDGCTTVLPYPAGYRALGAELARVVRPGGLVVLRLFTSPDPPETLRDVHTALGTIQTFDALKWRIAMAIQAPDRSVEVARLRDVFDALVPDRAALAARTGWRPEVIDHVDIYRASPARYSFPTRAEVTAAFAPHLVERSICYPAYELGERCPTVVWRRP